MAAESMTTGRVATRRPRVRWRRHVEGWMFIGPVIFGIVAFQLAPILVSLYASLTSWDGMNPPEMVGLENYRQLMTDDPFFRETVRNTMYFVAGHILLTISIALGLTLLCNRQIRGISLFRTAYFMPAESNVVAISAVWLWLYQPREGVLTGLLSSIWRMRRNSTAHRPLSSTVPVILLFPASQKYANQGIAMTGLTG